MYTFRQILQLLIASSVLCSVRVTTLETNETNVTQSINPEKVGYQNRVAAAAAGAKGEILKFWEKCFNTGLPNGRLLAVSASCVCLVILLLLIICKRPRKSNRYGSLRSSAYKKESLTIADLNDDDEEDLVFDARDHINSKKKLLS